MGRVNEKENRSKISVTADSLEEAKKIFSGLYERGEVEVPDDAGSEDSFFTMFRDKFGIEWVIGFDSVKRSEKKSLIVYLYR